MVGWMDDEALHRTLTTGRSTFWSRSRQEYWVKGETSGHKQWVKEVRLDCDGDTLLVVDQVGAAPPHREPYLFRQPGQAARRCLSPVHALAGARARDAGEDKDATPDRSYGPAVSSASPGRGSPPWRAAETGPPRAATPPGSGSRPRSAARSRNRSSPPSRSSRWRPMKCCWSPVESAGCSRWSACSPRPVRWSRWSSASRRHGTTPWPRRWRRARRETPSSRASRPGTTWQGWARCSAAAFGVAAVRSPRWPAMGSKYDARHPGRASTADEDMWRALDEDATRPPRMGGPTASRAAAHGGTHRERPRPPHPASRRTTAWLTTATPPQRGPASRSS